VTKSRIAVYDAFITLETPSLVADGQGGSVLTLTPGESRWARVACLPGDREDGRRGVRHRYQVHFREVFELSEHTHIIWRGQRLQIVAIRQEPGRFGALSVECISGRGL
jgi:head-tail adaptor